MVPKDWWGNHEVYKIRMEEFGIPWQPWASLLSAVLHSKLALFFPSHYKILDVLHILSDLTLLWIALRQSLTGTWAAALKVRAVAPNPRFRVCRDHGGFMPGEQGEPLTEGVYWSAQLPNSRQQ